MQIICDECKIPSVVKIDNDGNGQCEICKTTYKIKLEKTIQKKKSEDSIYLLWYGASFIGIIFLCSWLVSMFSHR